jgi:2-hydroxy-6-oxonona-2,4-dienedioate hydrolase
MSRSVLNDGRYVYRAPRGARPHVVLLPGLIAGEWMWRPTIDALARAGYGCLAPAEAFAIDHDRVTPLKHIVIDLMDRCGIESAVMAGGSFGSRVALDCAIAFPERVQMLVLSGAPGAITTAQLGISFQGKVTRSIGAKVRDRLFADRGCISDETVAQTLQIFGERRRLLNLIRLMKECSEFDYAGALRAIASFVLLIWGVDDVISPCPLWHELARSVRHGAFHAIERCGHLPMVERPEIFNPILLRQLQQERVEAAS